MKISPQQYAQVLVESVKENNISDIAKTFWHKLQKNDQYKDLSKVIIALDKEYAKLNNKVLVQVYSEKELDSEQLNSLEQKIAKKYSLQGKIIIRNIIKKNITGIIVKIDDTEIHLCLEDKINRLKSALNAV